eukprot:GHRR01012475.1.p1 GENE.GHRR01012475.1~~GHRR01012475.1.p1  ORF type:complete len:126 (-),score=41.69 GHRR01012475.1:1213-1590(-)
MWPPPHTEAPILTLCDACSCQLQQDQRDLHICMPARAPEFTAYELRHASQWLLLVQHHKQTSSKSNDSWASYLTSSSAGHCFCQNCAVQTQSDMSSRILAYLLVASPDATTQQQLHMLAQCSPLT